MSELLTEPLDGLPPLVDTPQALDSVVAAIADGYGPLAVDTERASSFRFDDRAFLLQLRRPGAGTFLIDSERLRPHLAPLAEVINPLRWILHAGSSDLPALRDLGLIPAEIFDTERAARIASLSPVNLGAITELMTGYTLAKNHGSEDWSRRPLPESWLRYAALDVEFLVEIAEALTLILAEQDRLEWAIEENEYIRREFALSDRPGPHDEDAWMRMKGFGKLSTPVQRRIAHSLWQEREQRARKRDISPHRILANDALISAARSNPQSAQQLRDIARFPKDKRWWNVVQRAKRSKDPLADQATTRGYRGSRTFPRGDRGSRAGEIYEQLNTIVEQFDEQLNLDHGIPIEPRAVRHLAWRLSGDDPSQYHAKVIDEVLRARGVRPWQRSLFVPAFAGALISGASPDAR